MNIRALFLVAHVTGNTILSEGHIADGKVKGVIRIVGALKGLIGNSGIRVDMSGNPGSAGVKLHAMDIAGLPDAFRHIL